MAIQNTAELSGSKSVSVNDEEKYTEVSSGGGASYRQNFTLTKVDVNNYGTTLAGATYSLYMYNGTEWVNTGGTYTTDGNGQISFSFNDSGIYNFIDGDYSMSGESIITIPADKVTTVLLPSPTRRLKSMPFLPPAAPVPGCMP